MVPEHPAGCSKRPTVSPAQPRRAKTRRSAGAAAASEEGEAYTIFTRPPIACKSRRFPRPYVEPLSDARTKLGEGRVSARRDRAGVMSDFFSILLGSEHGAQLLLAAGKHDLIVP